MRCSISTNRFKFSPEGGPFLKVTRSVLSRRSCNRCANAKTRTLLPRRSCRFRDEQMVETSRSDGSDLFRRLPNLRSRAARAIRARAERAAIALAPVGILQLSALHREHVHRQRVGLW